MFGKVLQTVPTVNGSYSSIAYVQRGQGVKYAQVLTTAKLVPDEGIALVDGGKTIINNIGRPIPVLAMV